MSLTLPREWLCEAYLLEQSPCNGKGEHVVGRGRRFWKAIARTLSSIYCRYKIHKGVSHFKVDALEIHAVSLSNTIKTNV